MDLDSKWKCEFRRRTRKAGVAGEAVNVAGMLHYVSVLGKGFLSNVLL